MNQNDPRYCLLYVDADGMLLEEIKYASSFAYQHQDKLCAVPWSHIFAFKVEGESKRLFRLDRHDRWIPCEWWEYDYCKRSLGAYK